MYYVNISYSKSLKHWVLAILDPPKRHGDCPRPGSDANDFHMRQRSCITLFAEFTVGLIMIGIQ